jgi:hypothetical protein
MILICHQCQFQTDVAVGEPADAGRARAQAIGWDFRTIPWTDNSPVLVAYCPHCKLLVDP